MDNKISNAKKSNTIKYILIMFTACFFVIILANPVKANPVLGVNYYGESLMGVNGINYIPRNISEVAFDLDHIHQISSHIKMYMNPFVDQNLPWVEQILQLAKQRGMYTVVNMMVDDRQLDNSNWNDYSTRVITDCAALAGKTDEVLVGNEIILHSSMNNTDIQSRVVTLINACEQVFPGPVSYEEFWWSHNAWQNYTGKIYLMQYEDLSVFNQNTIIMDQMFGSNAIVGEWGEDLLDGSIVKDENWQRDQVALRYNILSKTKTPVAYIFTYEEQSWNAFGIVRPDGVERPVWTYLKSLGYGDGTGPITPPIIIPPQQQSNTTVYVVNSFMADSNTVFVCNANGFTPTSYSWDFSDGLSALNLGVNDVYHSFLSSGTFTITCTASNGTINATGGITINVNSRGIGPTLVQQVIPLSNNNYNLYCNAIGYKPGYCQKITSTNGFSYDWGCTSGSPGFGNLSINLANDGDYILQCVMHLSDSSQLQNYYTEGSMYHINTCNTSSGCILVQQNISFVVGNGTPIIPSANNTVNLTVNNTVNNTIDNSINLTVNNTENNMSINSTVLNQSSTDTTTPTTTITTTTTTTSTGGGGGGGGGGGVYIPQYVTIIDTTNTTINTTIINNTDNISTVLTSTNTSTNISITSTNTSIITIQQNQTSPITGFLAASLVGTPSSVATAPITATDSQATTTNNLSWIWWIVGGILVLLMIAWIIIPTINSTRQKNIQSSHNNSSDVYPVIAIEGIGQKYNNELQAIGIKNTTQLREANAIKVAREIGASLGSVKSWQHMAELSSVKDIGPQYAELLEHSGIHSIDQLGSYNPDELLKLMSKKQDSLKIVLQGNSADYATVEHWINEARDHQLMESRGEIA